MIVENSKVNPSEFTNWALPMDVLQWLEGFIIEKNIKSIVECGSGLSTIFLGEMQQKGVIERSLTLEDNQDWYDYTCRKLLEKNLADYTEVKLTPRKQQACNKILVSWYNISGIEPFDADLIIVDGPPSRSAMLARHPAPHLLKNFIKPGTYLVIDDYFRSEESKTVEMWLEELPITLIEILGIGKGLALLQYL
ncbi:hypothetical protein VB713_20505 [Anabaena cylindrica UHCC 0172]|uniref:hypothetical protein n=1 Tax=Anabaena cylindrica TaxID=1165 RepID=UPI002B1FBCC8|nr:hypothetical protein [Anabaena cylindrica]MEA5553324.1 hypothetical protein [Anabaena cylindrica UHCC 0172]